ncbi:MAG: hypothetical protein WCJ30_22070, partial [Deltaproteobacteria bacterium]
MSAFDLTPFDAFARGATPPAPLEMSWGVHDGMRGARWLSVGSDGLVQETTFSPSARGAPVRRPLGRVGLDEVRALAGAIASAGLVSRPDADPAHRLTLALRCGQDRLEWAFASGDGSSGGLRAVVAAFERVRQGATAVPARPAPMDVRLAASSWVMLVFVGVFTFGVGALGLLLTWRRFPRRMDADGLTLRSGRSFRWSELTLRRRVAAHRPSLVLGYDLLAGDGAEIRIAP